MMSKFWMVVLSALFLIPIAIPSLTQEAKSPEIRQVIEQRLAQDGFYLGDPGFSDGLRYIEILSDNQVALWGLGNCCSKDGQVVIPLAQFTRTFIDLSDPHLRVIVGENNQYLGKLMDTCLATGYPEKYIKDDVVFWLLEGKRKKP